MDPTTKKRLIDQILAGIAPRKLCYEYKVYVKEIRDYAKKHNVGPAPVQPEPPPLSHETQPDAERCPICGSMATLTEVRNLRTVPAQVKRICWACYVEKDIEDLFLPESPLPNPFDEAAKRRDARRCLTNQTNQPNQSKKTRH